MYCRFPQIICVLLQIKNLGFQLPQKGLPIPRDNFLFMLLFPFCFDLVTAKEIVIAVQRLR